MTFLAFGVAVLQIAWINILLSGDNAMVIALASRSLPRPQRRKAMVFGAVAAIVLRILIAFVISYLLNLPLLKVAGGLLLLWIAAKLIIEDNGSAHQGIAAAEGLWQAVRIIAAADVVMSLDNVLAVAAAAGGRSELFIFGLVLSIPLVIAGSQLIVAAIERLPILVWVGGALLGWVAGEMIVGDRLLLSILPPTASDAAASPADWLRYAAGAAGAVLVVFVSLAMKRRSNPPA